MKTFKIILLVCATLAPACAPTMALADPSCAAFDSKTLTFAGTPLQQARCLLRGNHEWGHLDHEPIVLPKPLAERVGQKVEISVAQFRAFLKAQGINEADIGGSLDEKLARGNSNAADAPEAGYFVVHDTSTPNLGVGEFPPDMNTRDWAYNTLVYYVRGKPTVVPGCVKSEHPETQPVAHVFINRMGESVAPVDFSIPWRATKFESQNDCRAKGLFLHTELIMPRRTDPSGRPGNDGLHPEPAFTAEQYRRLAIVYTAASLRKGSWLVPTFHATLDEGISDGHDDPQGFEVVDWANALEAVVRAVQAPPAARPVEMPVQEH